MIFLKMIITFYFSSEPTPKRMRSPNSTKLSLNDCCSPPIQPAPKKEILEQSPIRVEEPPLEVEKMPQISEVNSDDEKAESIAEYEKSIEKFTVVKDGLAVDSWMCKTCNCIFLNEVNI